MNTLQVLALSALIGTSSLFSTAQANTDIPSGENKKLSCHAIEILLASDGNKLTRSEILEQDFTDIQYNWEARMNLTLLDRPMSLLSQIGTAEDHVIHVTFYPKTTEAINIPMALDKSISITRDHDRVAYLNCQIQDK